jgi:hypothetical protein
MTIKTNCPAEACLREWVAVVNQPAEGDDALDARGAAKKVIEDRASQVIARSDIGAAFQLLLAITSWPWSPADVDDHEGELSEEASASLTDGTDYKRRLMISAYFHLSRALQDADLRQAERHATSEDMDPGGLFLWLVEAQSTVDIRHLLAA